jgi:hypothetical protein
MKKTAVEFLVQELTRLGHNFNLYKKEIEQAKEMEKQQKDEFAIGFAEWIRVCKLKGRPYDFDNTKELLEIYKKEQGL